MQMMREEFEAENEGIVIPTQVRLLANPRTIRERRQNGEIAASSVVFVVQGCKEAQSMVKNGNKAVGVWYRVELYMNAGPDSRCELGCGWGHIENKCGSKPKCGYCSGQPRTSDQNCNVEGCTAKQGSLCGHTLEKCPNCKGNLIAFNSRCVKKTEAAEAVQQRRKIELTGRASKSSAGERETAMGSNRVVLGPRHKGVVEGGGDHEEMAVVDEEQEAVEESRYVTMAETETATRSATATDTETETGALATNDENDSAELRKVI